MPEEHDDRDFRAMSNTDNFVHLHVHTDYSMLDGAAKVGELLDKAVELKMPALAITDHGNNFGAFDFWEQATKKGIKPIIGIEYKPFLSLIIFACSANSIALLLFTSFISRSWKILLLIPLK